jgi:translocation and assembly module TamB
LAEDSSSSSSSSSSTSTSTPTAVENDLKSVALPEVWIPLNINVMNFDVERFTLHQATAPIVVNRLTLVANAVENDVEIESFELDMPEADLSANVKVTLKDTYPLAAMLSSSIKLAQAKGQTAQAKLSGSIDTLGLDLKLGGLVTGDIQGQVQLLDPTLPFDVTMNELKGQWPLVDQPTDVKAHIVNGEAKGTLERFSLLLQGNFSGNNLPDTALFLEGQGSQTNITLPKIQAVTLGGKVDGELAVDWGNILQVDTDLTLTDIQPGQQWVDLPGLINGHLVASASMGGDYVWKTNLSTLAIKGELLNYPLDISGVVEGFQRQTGDPIQLSTTGLTLAHGANKVYAVGRLSERWDMNVDLMIPDLSKSMIDASGEIEGNIKLLGDMKQPQMALDLKANNITWRDQIKMVNATLKGNAQPLPKPSADVRLNIEQLDYEANHLDHVELKLEGSATKHRVNLVTQAPWGNSELEVLGQLNKEMTEWLGTFNQFVFTSDPYRFYLEKPFPIIANLVKQQVTVDAHCWRESEASLCLQQRSTFSAKKAQAELALSNFNFEQIQHFIPDGTQISGQANADISLEYRQGKAPKLNAQIALGKGKVIQKLAEPITFGWDKVSLQANLANDQLITDILIDLTDNGEFSLNTTISDITSAEKAIDGQLAISKVTLEEFGPLLGEYGRANAVINSQLKLRGALSHPQVFGQMTISDIIAQGEITPVDIESGEFSISFSGYQANLNAALVTADGQLGVEGEANWQDMDQWWVNSHVFASELQIVVPPMVDIKASPDLRLTMTPGKANVEGEIKLPWGQIVVEELPASATKVSSDAVIVNANLEPITEDNSLPFEFNTDVRINIGDEFSLEAFGLNANLIGLLNISQRDNSPFVTGEVNIIDGTYRSFGQDLIIKKGQILMHGPVDQPYVAITAIRNPENIEDDVEAGIKVTGSADAPSVSVYSDPAMAQANALSYLLRGQNLDTESSDNSMTTALIGLSLAQSGKVVGEIGQAFGVDNLQLDTAGSGDDSQVTVSGYVLPGLQVKYGVGIFTSVGEFTVRYRLMKDLYVEAVSGLTSAVDLLYQFEFD